MQFDTFCTYPPLVSATLPEKLFRLAYQAMILLLIIETPNFKNEQVYSMLRTKLVSSYFV